MVNNADRQRLAKRMRWAGRIICLVITVFGGTMLIGEAVSEFLSQGFVTKSIEGSLLFLIGIVALVLAPLGGCWWPLFILPKWMQALAKITPHGWATTGFNKLMLFGADFSAVVPEMLALAGFAVVFGIIAVWRFRTSAA